MAQPAIALFSNVSETVAQLIAAPPLFAGAQLIAVLPPDASALANHLQNVPGASVTLCAHDAAEGIIGLLLQGGAFTGECSDAAGVGSSGIGATTSSDLDLDALGVWALLQFLVVMVLLVMLLAGSLLIASTVMSSRRLDEEPAQRGHVYEGDGLFYVSTILCSSLLMLISLVAQLAEPAAGSCATAAWLWHLGVSSALAMLLSKVLYIVRAEHDAALLQLPLETRDQVVAIAINAGGAALLLGIRSAAEQRDAFWSASSGAPACSYDDGVSIFLSVVWWCELILLTVLALYARAIEVAHTNVRAIFRAVCVAPPALIFAAPPSLCNATPHISRLCGAWGVGMIALGVLASATMLLSHLLPPAGRHIASVLDFYEAEWRVTEALRWRSVYVLQLVFAEDCTQDDDQLQVGCARPPFAAGSSADLSGVAVVAPGPPGDEVSHAVVAAATSPEAGASASSLQPRPSFQRRRAKKTIERIRGQQQQQQQQQQKEQHEQSKQAVVAEVVDEERSGRVVRLAGRLTKAASAMASDRSSALQRSTTNSSVTSSGAGSPSRDTPTRGRVHAAARLCRSFMSKRGGGAASTSRRESDAFDEISSSAAAPPTMAGIVEGGQDDVAEGITLSSDDEVEAAGDGTSVRTPGGDETNRVQTPASRRAARRVRRAGAPAAAELPSPSPNTGEDPPAPAAQPLASGASPRSELHTEPAASAMVVDSSDASASAAAPQAEDASRDARTAGEPVVPSTTSPNAQAATQPSEELSHKKQVTVTGTAQGTSDAAPVATPEASMSKSRPKSTSRSTRSTPRSSGWSKGARRVARKPKEAPSTASSFRSLR